MELFVWGLIVALAIWQGHYAVGFFVLFVAFCDWYTGRIFGR